MGSRGALPAVLLLLLLSAVSCAEELNKSKNSSTPFLMPITDADLATFLTTLPTQDDPVPVDASSQLKEMVQSQKERTQAVWDHILGPTARARYDALTKAPCAFSVDEKVYFLKWDELKGDEELDRIYLTYYCASRERSNRFMQAARIRLKQQYPNLSRNDIETLVAEELEKERARWMVERKLLSPSRGLACTSNRVGGYTYTDCY